MEEKNATLQDTISRLKEEVMNVENRRSNLEQDLRRMNQEYNEMVRKLSVSEATLEVALKVWYCTGSALICFGYWILMDLLCKA